MCMKNVNLNPVFCTIVPTEDNSSVSLANIGNKCFKIQSYDQRRIISQVSLALFISATQTKIPEEAAKIDPDVTFSFQEDYDIKIRLTETISGDFKDLDIFLLEPMKYAVSDNLCRMTLNHTRLCVFPDLDLPPEKDLECFAIKALIRRHDDSRSQDDGWAVQAILPLKTI